MGWRPPTRSATDAVTGIRSGKVTYATPAMGESFRVTSFFFVSIFLSETPGLVRELQP